LRGVHDSPSALRRPTILRRISEEIANRGGDQIVGKKSASGNPNTGNSERFSIPTRRFEPFSRWMQVSANSGAEAFIAQKGYK
jgi:hypothetical protein